ncbi:MAG: shikimate kinase [Ruminococcaceae bacterium]|nr:shikimate kinase [Oscillospiraceae bacterium]
MGKYYLIGEHLSHSFSPQVHAMLGNPDYSLKELAPEAVGEFLWHGDYQGLNVTIPYKQTVIPYLDELTPAAAKLGAVNTITRRPDGTLLGDNTDYFGFSYALQSAGIALAQRHVLILGSGGAAKTAVAVAKDQGAASVTVVSRSGKIHYENVYDLCENAQVIVNCTPVGMYPKSGHSPIDLAKFPHLCGAVDMIYNPARTVFMAQAEQLGLPRTNGLSMLVSQAAAGHERFTGAPIDPAQIARIMRAFANESANVVLIGMPGCGKSTVGEALAHATGKRLVDTDALIVQKAGMSIPEIFATQGEDAFRALEHEVICEVGMGHGQIIATGGGVVTRPENRYPLRQNATVIWLQRPIEHLPREGRPLSLITDLTQMYRVREPLYRAFCDAAIPNRGTPDAVAARILEALS